MKRSPKQLHDADDIVIDADSGDEIVAEETELAAHSLKDKLKVLRGELKVAKKERDEHLAGWQRSKADLANFRRLVEEDKQRDAARAKGSLVRSLIPALDSFESAMAASSWASVDEEWRKGVERIAAQLHKALEHEGLQAYGEEGDAFSPDLHECMSVVPTDDATKDHTLAQVLQKGYKVGDEVVRAAKVVVAQTDTP